MRPWLADRLRHLANWLYASTIPYDLVLAARAKVLVLEQEEKDTTRGCGERKRHQVYARFIKDFPDRRKCDLAYAIEVVLQGVRYGQHYGRY